MSLSEVLICLVVFSVVGFVCYCLALGYHHYADKGDSKFKEVRPFIYWLTFGGEYPSKKSKNKLQDKSNRN